MKPSMASDVSRSLDTLFEHALHAARIPGGAIAVVHGQETVYHSGFGYRDLYAKLPMTPDTVYPIASTAKAMTATLLGMLVDAGRLAWDTPVRRYMPKFRLRDVLMSDQVTVRDLLTMRTGLPAHDFVWFEHPITRSDLLERLEHLALSAGLRERFQYNNLLYAVAGHVAEIITGRSWEEMTREWIFEPLGMVNTGFERPASGNVTLSYHENVRRELLPTRVFLAEPIGPAGGCTYSTVNDMTRWLVLNLNGGAAGARRLVSPETLSEIFSSSMLTRGESAAPSSHSAYGLGWFVDSYRGQRRISHTGYLDDVHGCVTLYPEASIGVVSFINFASSRLGMFMNDRAFDLVMGLPPLQSVAEPLAEYEQKIAATQERNASVCRVLDTHASHDLEEYVGCYEHPAYGRINIGVFDSTLHFERGALALPLEHWHYDAWVFAATELFEIHKQHEFDRTSRIVFETGADGDVVAFSMHLEPEVRPISFAKL